MKNALVITIDRWHVGYLGCYGNTWAETPEFDRLATEGFVFDQCFTPTLELAEQFPRLWWQGTHPLVKQFSGQNLFSTVPVSILLSDDPLVSIAGESYFSEVIALESAEPAELSEEIEGTHLAGCSAVVAETLGPLLQGEEPWFVWVHLRSLGDSWDAPLWVRERLREDDEEPLYSQAQPPEQAVTAETDPDELLSLQRAYAAQVMVLDTCLGPIFELVRSAADPPTMMVAGTRGYPLGEHGRVGIANAELHEESLHLPLILRVPGIANARSQALVQPQDFLPTLCHWWNLPTPEQFACESWLPLIEHERDSLRDRLVMVGPQQLALRTPAWFLIQSRNEENPEVQLFVKPDDRWERNEVADRVPQIAEAMQQTLDAWQAAADSDPPGKLSRLPEELCPPPE